MRLMMKKLNEKYSGVLNEAQKSIVRAYVWASTQDEPDSIKQKLTEVRTSLVESISEFIGSNPSNEYVNKKLEAVQGQLRSEALDVVDDDLVTRFMLYIKLNEELTSEETSNVNA